MMPKHRPTTAAADSPNFERMVKLVTAAAVGGVFLIAGFGALAQTAPPKEGTPAQKQPAKPGAQAGESPVEESSRGYSPRRAGQPGAPESVARTPAQDEAKAPEKTPAKPGAQSGKQPKSN